MMKDVESYNNRANELFNEVPTDECIKTLLEIRKENRMNREIKFRAFWKDTLKPVGDFNTEYLINACNDDLFIVNQYTGLQDKNGKDIYEGDICKIPDWDAFWEASPDIHISRAYEYDKDIIDYFKACQVRFEDGAFWLDDSELYTYNCQVEVEVIGNIFENPELIGEKQ